MLNKPKRREIPTKMGIALARYERKVVERRRRRRNVLARSTSNATSTNGIPCPPANTSITTIPCRTPSALTTVITRMVPKIGPAQADQLAPKVRPMMPEHYQVETIWFALDMVRARISEGIGSSPLSAMPKRMSSSPPPRSSAC